MTEFKLPSLGENIKSGNVVKINVSIGQTIQKDQPLIELETDKATVEVPSPMDGVIQEILIKEGQDVKIGQVILKIEEKETAGKSKTAVAAESSKIEQPIRETSPASPPGDLTQTTSSASSAPILPVSAEVSAAPSVRRFAREIGIEIAKVPGTGPRGRISLEDVKAYAKRILTSVGAQNALPLQTQVSTKPLPDFAKWGDIDRQSMNNIRKKTAQHLSYAWVTIPHVTQFDKADITEIEKLRKRHSTAERKLTITPFLLKVIASALKEFPQFNASVDMTTNEIIYKKYFHIGVAVDTDRGLLVPVIRDVDKKNIFQLADELNQLAERARDKKLTLEEMQGGCLSLTNLGGIGGTNFTPIVNWPEVAIVGISRAQIEAVYQDNQFIPRFMLPLSLSYDHRLIDGADGARFLRWVCEAIEQPSLMELEENKKNF